ncbi:hypothetical protein [Caloranaerobacter azorensis]|uniref:Uncharacterized protein n=1 Tax=Caloranaerobacter azorensis TaxID=116090 RepID=A0A6P1YAK2_9FIRM|nr:hypothetical protein [Caloranaerobacter azorensis]QIB26067.1 hypothetical protein G3A45_01325 [Caloranaerobacter azorensis]
MLLNMVQKQIGYVSEEHFRLALDMATDDIKANRIAFGKRTSLEEALEIIIACIKVVQKIEKGSSTEPPTQNNYNRNELLCASITA